MKIFGVNITYDEKETGLFREQYKNTFSSKKLRKLRVYELTNEFDLFRKYAPTFGFWDVVIIHIKAVGRRFNALCQ